MPISSAPKLRVRLAELLAEAHELGVEDPALESLGQLSRGKGAPDGYDQDALDADESRIKELIRNARSSQSPSDARFFSESAPSVRQRSMMPTLSSEADDVVSDPSAVSTLPPAKRPTLVPSGNEGEDAHRESASLSSLASERDTLSSEVDRSVADAASVLSKWPSDRPTEDPPAHEDVDDSSCDGVSQKEILSARIRIALVHAARIRTWVEERSVTILREQSDPTRQDAVNRMVADIVRQEHLVSHLKFIHTRLARRVAESDIGAFDRAESQALFERASRDIEALETVVQIASVHNLATFAQDLRPSLVSAAGESGGSVGTGLINIARGLSAGREWIGRDAFKILLMEGFVEAHKVLDPYPRASMRPLMDPKVSDAIQEALVLARAAARALACEFDSEIIQKALSLGCAAVRALAKKSDSDAVQEMLALGGAAICDFAQALVRAERDRGGVDAGVKLTMLACALEHLGARLVQLEAMESGTIDSASARRFMAWVLQDIKRTGMIASASTSDARVMSYYVGISSDVAAIPDEERREAYAESVTQLDQQINAAVKEKDYEEMRFAVLRAHVLISTALWPYTDVYDSKPPGQTPLAGSEGAGTPGIGGGGASIAQAKMATGACFADAVSFSPSSSMLLGALHCGTCIPMV